MILFVLILVDKVVAITFISSSDIINLRRTYDEIAVQIIMVCI